MTRPPIPAEQRRKYLLMLVIAVVLAVAYMIFLIRTDTSLPNVSRRVGSPRAITYSRNPTQFLFGFFPLVLGMFVFVMIVSAIIDGVKTFRGNKDSSPYARSNSGSGTARRVVSALLSLIVPGLGQAVGAHFVRAAGWLFAFILTTVVAFLMFLYLPSIVGVILPLLLIVALRIAVVVDASRLELNRPNIQFSRRAASVAGFVVAYLVFNTGFDIARRRLFGEAFRLPSASMQPSLLLGDYVMAVPVSGAEVVRNQIIMFRWPDDAQRFVYRAVGIAGDTLSMRSGKLLVNGREVVEPYAIRDASAPEPTIGESMLGWQKNFLVNTAMAEGYQPTRDNWGPLVVPRNSFFVLGDNRDNSLDSRYRGLVSADAVSLTPRRVYYSRDPDYAFHWNRIGKMVNAPQP